MIIGEFFGHTLVFLEKISLITTRKAEMLDGMFPAQIECNCLPVYMKMKNNPILLKTFTVDNQLG